MAVKPAKLDKRLILNEWMFRQLGLWSPETGMKQLSAMLRDTTTGWDAQNVFHFRTASDPQLMIKEDTGWDAQNVFHFRHALEKKLPVQREITNDLLAEYDRNIFIHWQAVTAKRRIRAGRDVVPLYFQYLSLLFTEYYLDRWTRDIQQKSDSLLQELNAFRYHFNLRFPFEKKDRTGKTDWGERIAPYEKSDLTRLAFWIATGGGKTLIMHCHIRQIRHYLETRNLRRNYSSFILITPNEGLSDQHLQEFRLSGMDAGRMGDPHHYGIKVVEITKLRDKKGETTFDVEHFGTNNIVMVDEGHRGSGGDEWFSKRQELCKNGFSFEYSATFGQAVNALSGDKNKETGQLYAKSILFDYSYKFFYGDGFGKDFHILNFTADQTRAQSEIHRLYLTACLLRFYQQSRLFRDRRAAFAPYLLDDPLMVFVGGSVTGQREKAQDTDIVSALKFFAVFLSDEAGSIHHLDLLLRGRDELKDNSGPVFRNSFAYVQNCYPLTEPDAAVRVYQDILRLVFNAGGKGLLHAVYLKGSEIGLRVGEGDYFGVINVGEPKKLWDMVQEQAGESVICSEHAFSVSLFDSIKAPGSRIRLLMGAKKFTEGWDCWRVSCMGLINIGRKEGSQIIQLFGRGVRLKGLDFKLKRSREIPFGSHPAFLSELETLNVFGVRSDYMQAFNEYMDEEDVMTEKKTEIISLPVIENLTRTDLKVILPKKNMPDFRAQTRPKFGRHEAIRTKVSADWQGRVFSKTLNNDSDSIDEPVSAPVFFRPENRKYLDYDKLYLELLHFKKQQAMYNLVITREAVRDLFAETDWYELYLPEHLLEFTGFDKVELWQEIAADLLKRYCRKYYHFCKNAFEGPYQEYRSIQEILDDPGDRHNRQFLETLKFEYQIAVEKSREYVINHLKNLSRKIREGELTRTDFMGEEYNLIHFDSHLYHPLIHIRPGIVSISVKPVSLNLHEKQFIEDMKKWYYAEKDRFLKDKELFVLRNQTRGKGVSFFDEGGFSPDFILWLLWKDRQYISFADPHGLQHSDGPNDSKIRFYEQIREMERQYLRDDSVILNSFILSPTRHRDIQKKFRNWSKEEFREHHVFFLYDDAENYISGLFSDMTGQYEI